MLGWWRFSKDEELNKGSNEQSYGQLTKKKALGEGESGIVSCDRVRSGTDDMHTTMAAEVMDLEYS